MVRDFIVEMMSETRLEVGDMEDMDVGIETCVLWDDVLHRCWVQRCWEAVSRPRIDSEYLRIVRTWYLTFYRSHDQEVKDRGCRSVIWVGDPWVMWIWCDECRMRTRLFIGWQGINAVANLLQLETVIQAFLFRSIGLIAGTRCASLVARTVQILVMTLKALKMKWDVKCNENEWLCEGDVKFYHYCHDEI